jgi:DNA-binding CsgD family transcriptional regulator
MADPAVEKYLLNLQRAMNVDAFWKAAQQLLTAAIPNFADNALALELKIDLSQSGRARLLRRLGKRMGASATDKRELGDSVRLDRCRQLKQQWARAQRPSASRRVFKRERVHLPRSPDLRATVRLKQLSSADLARPHFLIECEPLHRHTVPHTEAAASRLPHLARLTGRQQEITRLVCDGRSNQEIADIAGLSLAMVKKHLHAVFHKLEVTSRSQLMALMR